jgi:hypothetical protein
MPRTQRRASLWQSSRVVGQDGAYEPTDIEFDAEGATLRGWLYRPRSQTSPAPVVVMAHGYNCLKEFYLDKYAASIAAAGHVVLAYDHRNFGERDGEPRQELVPAAGRDRRRVGHAGNRRGTPAHVGACDHGAAAHDATARAVSRGSGEGQVEPGVAAVPPVPGPDPGQHVDRRHDPAEQHAELVRAPGGDAHHERRDADVPVERGQIDDRVHPLNDLAQAASNHCALLR